MEYAIEVLTRERLNIRAEIREVKRMSDLQQCNLVGEERIKRLKDIEEAIDILQRTTSDKQN